MTPDANQTTDPTTSRQLLHQAKVIAQLRTELDELASTMTDSIAGVLGRVEAVEDSTDPTSSARTPTAWCWRNIGPHAADALWTELADWVCWIRHRYPLARRVPDCWPEHPELVEELTALWLAWQAAYTERDASLTAAIDWHDRWLPGLLFRLEHGPFALDCTGSHRPRPASTYAELVPSTGSAGSDEGAEV